MPESSAFALLMLVLLALGLGTWRVVGRKHRPLAADVSIDWPPGLSASRGAEWARPSTTLAALLVLGGVLVGGWYLLTPSWQQVFNRYGGRIDEMERLFLELGQSLPPPGVTATLTPRDTLYPLLVFDEVLREFNTEIVSEQQLFDPSASSGAYYLSGDLAMLLRWRHDPPSTSHSKAARGLAEHFEATLLTRYLVVVRAESQANGSLGPGEVFVFDLRSKALLRQFAFAGGDFANGRRELLISLSRATGGTFRSD
jgi:hypothetical protein